MCLFKYREKRYGKLTLILTGLIILALAAASFIGGIYAFKTINNWGKYALLVVLIIVGIALAVLALAMLLVSTGMMNKSKSVRDENRMKGVSGTRLCDNCGRVITKNAEFCEHCGTKQKTGVGMKACPNCKTKNSGTAEFCEKCGTKFED